jgi:hypothetical protein
MRLGITSLDDDRHGGLVSGKAMTIAAESILKKQIITDQYS